MEQTTIKVSQEGVILPRFDSLSSGSKCHTKRPVGGRKSLVSINGYGLQLKRCWTETRDRSRVSKKQLITVARGGNTEIRTRQLTTCRGSGSTIFANNSAEVSASSLSEWLANTVWGRHKSSKSVWLCHSLSLNFATIAVMSSCCS